MTRISLHEFTDSILDTKTIGFQDVSRLNLVVLPHGLTSRDEADILIALDRAIAGKDPAWGTWLVSAVVQFVVWTSRPTGHVDGETIRWLTGSLGCGTGPTDTAMRIAFEIIREAERVDQALIQFVMRSTRGRLDLLAAQEMEVDLAV